MSELQSMIERFSDAEAILWAEMGGDVSRRHQPLVDDWMRQVRAEGRLEHLPSLPPETPKPRDEPNPVRVGYAKGSPVVLEKDGERRRFDTQAEAAKSIGVLPGTLFQALKRGGKTRNGWQPRTAA